MRIKTELPRPINVIEDQRILMPDGCELSARIWLPKDADSNPVPMILEHLPYRKRDGTIARDEVSLPWMAGHGYACVRVDMRGTGDSHGLHEDEYTQQEWEDAISVMDWAREQPWCDGAFGMQGISWGGFNCLQVAALKPKGLKAIISICSTVDRYADDIHYKGGSLLNENLGWSAQMLAYSSRAPDPALAPNSWREMWQERLEAQPFSLETWLDHQTRDDFWKHGSICEDYSAIEVAVLSIGGWHDGYRNTINHLVSNISAPVKGIIGPWIHKYPHIAEPKPAIGFLQEAKRWWDHWLKDADTGVENDPDMRIYVMDSVKPKAWLPERPGRWIAETQWPSPNIANEVLHLTSAGLSHTAGDCNASVCSPADCGATGGEYFPFAYGPEFPIDQRGDDALSSCFDGPVLEHAIDLVGAANISLKLSADKPAAQVAVRLCDVFPDGTSAMIAHGMLNLQHRNSHEFPEAIVPDEVFDVQFDLDDCGYRVPAGHKLRVSVQTNYWPFLWPAPELATVTIHNGSITLPKRPLAEGDEWEFEPAEGSQPWEIETHRTGRCTRTRECDLETGETVMRISNGDGHVTDLKHGLSTSSVTHEEWRINGDNPLSAKADIRWFTTMGRDDWQTSTEAKASMTADASAFHIKAELRTWEGDDLVFERSFQRSILRNGL